VEKETFALNLPLNKKYAVIGLEKNIGKTSVLNWLSGVWSESGESTFLTTIGRDGEEEDVLDSRVKPVVSLRKGCCALTGDRLIITPSLIEIEEVVDRVTAAGKPVIVRALADTTVELVNPGSIETLIALADRARTDFRCSRTLIDGAFNRLSHARSRIADFVLLVTGAEACGTTEEVVERTIFTVQRLEGYACPKEIEKMIVSYLYEPSPVLRFSQGKLRNMYEKTLIREKSYMKDFEPEDVVYLRGALTESTAETLIQNRIPLRIVLRDGVGIQITKIHLNRLFSVGVTVSVLFSVPVSGIFVNHFGKKRSMRYHYLVDTIRERVPEKPVFDLFEVPENEF
jgi:hypothetical protein